MMRKTLFWIHLVAGLVCAIPLLVVAFTGVLLSVEPQVIDVVERDMLRVEPRVASVPISLDSVVSSARRVQAGKVTAVTMFPDALQAAVVRFGREGAVWVNPWSGAVQGTTTAVHATFAWLERVHRWLGSREIGGKVTGVSVLLCFLLSVSGMLLWWPRNLKALSQVVLPRRGLKGRARDWQWHNALGVLALPFLLVLSSTGAVMAWPWAEVAMFRVMGSEPPKRPQVVAKPVGEKTRVGGMSKRLDDRNASGIRTQDAGSEVGLQQILDTAMSHAPSGWSSATVRIPERPQAGATVLFVKPGESARVGTSVVLKPDGSFAEVRHPRSDLAFRLRAMLRPIHTGEQFGIIGQAFMAFAAMATLVLIWTGTAMSWRRFFRKRVEPA